MRKRLKIRKKYLENAERGGHEDRGIHRLCSEFGSDEDESHYQKDDIQRKRDRRDRQGDEIR